MKCVWTGKGTKNDFDDPTNWKGRSVPLRGDDVTFVIDPAEQERILATLSTNSPRQEEPRT